MKELSRLTVHKPTYPERIIQFGEGNFLRAFVDWIIQDMNETTDLNSSVVVVQPLEKGTIQTLNKQDCIYHVALQGLENGQNVHSLVRIEVISRALNPYEDYEAFIDLADQPEFRFVISYTSDGGLSFDPESKLSDRPASTFPGKLTQLLYHRFHTFYGDRSKGWIIFPCEPVFKNGHRLKEIIYKYIDLWNLGDGFRKWFEEACGVYTTLVDRIVPGAPAIPIPLGKGKTQYKDDMVVQAEFFHSWIIEAPKEVAKEFPADKAGLNIKFVDDETPYHTLKTALLNAPHTLFAPVAFLCGIDIVRDACEDEEVCKYIHSIIYDELIVTLDEESDKLVAFADAVMERFKNPFIDHSLVKIMHNSLPKYSTRVLPGLKTYISRKGVLPEGMIKGLAALLVYYKADARSDGKKPVPEDLSENLELLNSLWASGSPEEVAKGVLGAVGLWGEDLNQIPGLTKTLKDYIDVILSRGMRDLL